MEVPIFVSSNFTYFLGTDPKPNPKAFEVIHELTQAGIPRHAIWTSKRIKSTYSAIMIIRLLWRMPVAILFLLQQVKRKHTLDTLTWQVVVGYMIYKRFFNRNQHLIPIIISDVSPALNMQWSAAVSIGHDVLWWQDDYHHYKGFSNENYMPYKATIAVVLNQKGLETVRNKNPKAKVYHRDQMEVKPMCRIPLCPRLGVAGNVLFKAGESEVAHINELRLNLGAKHVKIRLHPNSKLIKKDFSVEWLELAAFNETLNQFANSVDVVLVGNSAVQLKLLCMGMPVILVPWLDPLEFDVYGYCERKFSYGLRTSKDISFQELFDFYSDPDLTTRLSEYVRINQEEEISPLSKLKE